MLIISLASKTFSGTVGLEAETMVTQRHGRIFIQRPRILSEYRSLLDSPTIILCCEISSLTLCFISHGLLLSGANFDISVLTDL